MSWSLCPILSLPPRRPFRKQVQFRKFVDVDERTYNISVHMLERFLKRQCVKDGAGGLTSLSRPRPVKAIVPVHLYGQMADMDAILSLADKYSLTVIEDACLRRMARSTIRSAMTAG